MGKKLATAIHLTQDGVVHSFLPGEEPPAWARGMITNPKAWGGAEPASEPAPGPVEATRTPGVPPKSGKGSGVQAWRDYADKNGIDVDDDVTREDIIAGLVANGIPTE